MPRARTPEPPILPRHAWTGPVIAALVALAPGPARGGPRDGATPTCTPDRPACVRDAVDAPTAWTFPVAGTGPLEATLRPAPGPDGRPAAFLAALLRCRTPACEDGRVAAAGEGGGAGGEVRLAVDAPDAGTWRLVVAAAAGAGPPGAAAAVVDVALRSDRGPERVLPARSAGGWTLPDREVRGGDVVVAVGLPGEGPADGRAQDPSLLWLGVDRWPCDADCGGFRASDDERLGADTSRLPRLRFPAGQAPARGRLLAGVAGFEPGRGPVRAAVRVVHLRPDADGGGAWEGPGHRDRDGDGLTAEAEAALGTCDDAADRPSPGVLAAGMTCAAVRDAVDGLAPGTWSPTDSDNDGLDDAAESFRVVAACEHAPGGPFGEAGACRRAGIREGPGCPAGWCASLDLPGLGADPATYDVFVVADAWHCAGEACADTHRDRPGDHAVTAAQQEGLRRAWTEDPATCWDGTRPPCPDPARDVPWRVRLHVLQGGPHGGRLHDLPDDAFGDEVLFNGARGLAGWFDRWFVGAGRHAGVFRYALATHWGGGQAPGWPSRAAVWGNDSPDAALGTFSHEAGHMLGLADLPTHDPGGTACPGARNRCSPDGPVWTQNPVLPSLMNYSYRRMPRKGAPPPGPDDPPFAGCEAGNLRFSKGLNRPLHEDRLCETNPGQDPGCGAGTADWRTRKMVAELACYDDLDHCDGTNPLRPACRDVTCRVEWDALAEGPRAPEPYAFDVSYGRLRRGEACAAGVLEDRDEWRWMIARGKAGLREPAYRDVALYQDTFNGGRSASVAGWDLPVEAACRFDRPARPANRCRADADCGRGTCRAGRCTCGGDRDCPAAGTRCDRTDGLCRDRDPGDDPPGGARPPRESAAFDGNGSGHHLRVGDGGPDGPWRAVALNGAFTALLELRFDGFAPGQRRQAVLRAGAYRLDVVPAPEGARLRASLDGGRPLEAPLEPGRWHRVTWRVSGTDREQDLEAVAWDPRTGAFAREPAPGACTWRGAPGRLPEAAGAWLGWDGGDPAARFHGRLDSVSLLAYRLGRRPEACRRP